MNIRVRGRADETQSKRTLVVRQESGDSECQGTAIAGRNDTVIAHSRIATFPVGTALHHEKYWLRNAFMLSDGGLAMPMNG